MSHNSCKVGIAKKIPVELRNLKQSGFDHVAASIWFVVISPLNVISFLPSPFLAQTCRLLPYDGWKVVRIKNARDIFVAHNSEHWYTYHNIEHVRTAAKYIQRNQLYGAAVLLDTDDYDNVCDEGKYPLLAAVHSILGAAVLNQTAAATAPDWMAKSWRKT